MNCAICDQESRAVSAIAICQRCGGGTCRAHLEILSTPGAPGDMAGMCVPKRESVCWYCLESSKARKVPRRSELKTPCADLPNGETAVQIAEILLFGKRQAAHSWPHVRLQGLRQWVTGLVSAPQQTEKARHPRG